MVARLPLPTAEKIAEFLRSGLTQRETARRLGVSPSTVNKIAAGKWDLARDPDDEHPFAREARHARRCPGCGALVYLWPCLRCEIRREPCRRPAGPDDRRRRRRRAGLA